MKHTITVNYIGGIAVTFTAESSNDGQSILEQVFGWFNAGSGCEHELFKKHRCRSLSVNDCVRVNKQWYQVQPVGWTQVDDEYVDFLEKSVVNHPAYEEHGEWYALSDVMWQLKQK